MITILILLAIIWIVLKIMLFMVELPFKFLGFLFRLPFSGIFWAVIIILFLISLF